MEFIAVDLETTGTLPYVDQIVEIAAVHFKNGEVQNVFQSLIDPGMRISEEVSSINGITNEMVQGKPKIATMLGQFSHFCSTLPMVAHNASFDFQFLTSAIKRNKTVAPAGVMLDTYTLAKKTLTGLNNYKLSTLIQLLKIKHGTLHRAEQDAICCGYVFLHIMKKLELTQLDRLIQLSGKAVFRFPQISQRYQQLQLSL